MGNEIGDAVSKVILSVMAYLIVFVLIGLIMYVVLGILLNKLNRKTYGKGTPLAWIPLLNIYLTIKLGINKILAIITIILLMLCSKLTLTINGTTKVYQLIPSPVNNYIIIAISILFIISFIIVIIKLCKKNRI